MASEKLIKRIEEIISLPIEEVNFFKLSDGLSPAETTEIIELLIKADNVKKGEDKYSRTFLRFRLDHEIDELTAEKLDFLLKRSP